MATVIEFRPVEDSEELWLRPVEQLVVKVRPLKRANATIAAIPALGQGPVRTIYEMTDADAEHLLRAAREVAQRRASTFREGERRTTQSTVRSPALRADAIRHWGCKCFCCSFDFEAFYGPIAKGVAVVHHLETFAKARGPRRTSVRDVRVVCDNCHRVLHLTKPPLGVDTLRQQLVNSGHAPRTAGN